MESAQPGYTRRSTLKLAAWSAPVIAAAAATPLASASGTSDLDLGVSLSSLPSASIKSHEFGLKVLDFASSGSSWTGSFDVDYFIAPDDAVLYIAAWSILTPGPSSSSGWTFVSLGTPGPNGPFSARFNFTGTIPSGSATTLWIDSPSRMCVERSGPSTSWPSSPYTTTRAANLFNVTGTPTSDTSAYNTTTQSINYLW